jgi:hypothetical protein
MRPSAKECFQAIGEQTPVQFGQGWLTNFTTHLFHSQLIHTPGPPKTHCETRSFQHRDSITWPTSLCPNI